MDILFVKKNLFWQIKRNDLLAPKQKWSSNSWSVMTMPFVFKSIRSIYISILDCSFVFVFESITIHKMNQIALYVYPIDWKDPIFFPSYSEERMHTSPVDSICRSIALDTVRTKNATQGVSARWPAVDLCYQPSPHVFFSLASRPCLYALVYDLIDFRNGRMHVYPHWRVVDRGERARGKINLVHTMSIDWTDSPKS